jgi:hypothetical protein
MFFVVAVFAMELCALVVMIQMWRGPGHVPAGSQLQRDIPLARKRLLRGGALPRPPRRDRHGAGMGCMLILLRRSGIMVYIIMAAFIYFH